jgi:hypothetical protein
MELADKQQTKSLIASTNDGPNTCTRGCLQEEGREKHESNMDEENAK